MVTYSLTTGIRTYISRQLNSYKQNDYESSPKMVNQNVVDGAGLFGCYTKRSELFVENQPQFVWYVTSLFSVHHHLPHHNILIYVCAAEGNDQIIDMNPASKSC